MDVALHKSRYKEVLCGLQGNFCAMQQNISEARTRLLLQRTLARA
jgi:hypothetical protein